MRHPPADITEADQERILHATGHRPYPLPRGPWIMRQRWNDLLFAHWPIAPAALAPHIPAGLELDTFAGEAWLGVVPFWMDRVRHRVPFAADATVSVPTVSRFPELNLRTYVRSPRSGKRGVFFFALDCASPLAVLGARLLFHLPYFPASMQHGEDAAGEITYRSRRLLTRTPAEVEVRYRARPGAPAPDADLTRFLTERYCLFTPSRGRILCGDIHHEVWPAEPAEADFRKNEMPQAHGFTLPDIAPVLHYSRELQVFLWPLHEDL